MEKPRDPRNVQMPFRVTEQGKVWIDQRAYDHHLTRADVVRACIAVAKKHSRELEAQLTAMERI